MLNTQPMEILFNVLVSSLTDIGAEFSFKRENNVPTLRTPTGIRVSIFSPDNHIDYVPERFYVRNNGYCSYMSFNEVWQLIFASEVCANGNV